ncbi:MAG TPA: zinc ribbon domain-containing protein [Vicinamibacterales bacterium]|nr:zinc ribbon domain-containing protein [Vicinamibacterales bacterium]HOQ61414.1 zinc ribbon domain-containing protein [Vicinamibacterales bacterium]HPK71519.1 zinc ribbon domain-containing protein [Vicinamibacterales bacterium]
MFCPACGAPFEPPAAFCGSCGTRLPQASPPSAPAAAPPAQQPEERELLRFGSFGVGITYGRPALFAWTRWNMIEVVLTDRRVCGLQSSLIARMLLSSRRGELAFQVPLADVVAMERLKVAARTAVYLKWREGAAFKEVSIEGGLGCSDHILRLHELLEQLLKARTAPA